jgi:hypothetical protein
LLSTAAVLLRRRLIRQLVARFLAGTSADRRPPAPPAGLHV